MLLLAAGIVVMTACSTNPPQDIGPWTVVDLGRVDNVVARLRVRERASMDQENWIAIEFENYGKEPVELTNVHYNIDRTAGGGSGGMASGNEHSLFPEAWDARPVKTLLQSGVHSIAGQPSDYSSALLGLPTRDGWMVKAVVDLSFGVKEHGRTSPMNRHAFEFEWRYPDEAGFERMRTRLKNLLAQPFKYVEQAYLVNAMLQIPEVAKAANVRALLAALDIHEGPFSGHDAILKYLNMNCADNADVIAYFEKRLGIGQLQAVSDLLVCPRIWTSAFVEPLLRICETNPSRTDVVARYAVAKVEGIEILAQRNPDQPADPAIAQRLSAAWLKAAGRLGQKPSELSLSERGEWSREMLLLGKTRDSRMIARIQPLLDDKTMVWDEANIDKLAFVSTSSSLPLTRACDVAMQAILTILDGSANRPCGGIDATRIIARRDIKAHLTAVKKDRDALTAALKQRLGATLSPR